ncbi:uncharacterized protein lcorl isoform X2 [Brienomyrus brachyistius]|uniref:uncharacterized protein lcorl isoform X2 n=1 Tax=Brienomyrus brachyistius TaxID=42636 RepID=UPI0020B3F57C|nr:uncharacterized protein lcorl isoform X2 [Brienomyrus brachyistius]
MATQCRSSKCTAERKGFRRELDSWRHKLIHCVGFESILEGIYGTRLLRDLSIFDDCEPDVVNDWSVDASCSFCSLQLEKIGDHIPAVCSLQSTPTEGTSPQGESNTEKIEYQADKFLHAIFRKKDLPQSCDPNIPLVAQELMKRMIRQFAIEYASKSQIQGGKNGSSLDTNLICDSQHPSDQDKPLDLTVNRNHLNVEQGGVLDLSQKNRSGSTLSTCADASTNQNTSGSVALAGGEKVHLDAEAEKLQIKCTVLQMVLSSFCPCHRMLLYHILKYMHEDYVISVTPYADGCRHFSQADSLSCRLGKNSDKDIFAFTDYRTSDGCCVHSCRLNSCSMTPVCICLKNLHYFSCQRMDIGCINEVCGPSSCGSYSHPQRCTCTYQSLSKSTYITPVRSVVSSPFMLHKVCDSFSPCIRACSPSPPPLSPIPLDVGAKNSDKSIICPFAESNCFSNQSASLFSHEGEDDPLFHEFDKDNASTEETEKHTPCEDCTDCCAQTERNFEQNQSGNVLQNLMECFKQLKPIEPLEKEQNSGPSAKQSLACSNGVHLEEILTTILHKETDDDCNLKEHFHRKQETLNAVRSPDLAPSWHQCVQIRRDIVSLGSLPCRRKLELETQGTIIARDYFKTQSCVDVLLTSPEKDKLSESEKSETTDTWNNRISPHHTELFCSRLENKGKSPERKGKVLKDRNCRNGNTDIKKLSLSLQPVTDASRSRRNIVPPQRFSAYVTEPRKMYFAACFSESIFNKRGQKDPTAVCAEISPSDLDLNESTTKLDLQNELSQTVRHAGRSGENICNDLKLTDFNLSDIPRTRSAKMTPPLLENATSDDGEVKGFQRRSKRRTVASLVKLRSLTNDQNHLNNEIMENNLSEGINTMKDALSTNECSLTPYSSPIRLMFVSPVISEEGIKYSLKSASSGSVSQPETFDPCVESSWCGLAKTEEKSVEVEPRVARGEENSPHKRPVTTDASSSSEELNIQREACLLVHGLSMSPPKRKPGRPKKLGPQIEKPAKRPIGRPPKHKGEISKCVSSKGSPNTIKNTACHSRDEDGGRRNKNLKITVVYGRSRRIRRLVSESSGHFGTDQQMKGLQSAYGCKTENDLNENSARSSANLESSDKLLGGPTEHFDLVIPVKNKRSHSSRNIKCTEQKCSVAMRKPGRPPKVKISGISVTVTTVSPKKRNISIDKDMTELNNEMPQKEKPFVSNRPKEQTTISLQSDAVVGKRTENVQGGTMSQKILVPLRHSVRIRKPSIHLLHSVATSRTFTHSNALLRRSRKLLMNKTSGESNQFKSFEKPFVETSGTTNSELFSRNPCGQDLSFLSGISVDSIFTSNEPFKWWHTSISAETLNDEFASRVQRMSDTWVRESAESSDSLSTEKELNLKTRMRQTENETPKNCFSPVKMLFQTHWKMDKLCAWFMQTTETQSLAIVKKASVRNPYEIVQYNPIRATSRTNVCPSPQAERLRKHVKKFAKIVPKSPAMQLKAQKRMFNASQLKVKRRLVLLRTSTIARGFGQRRLLSRHKMLGKYGFLLLRVKSKFMTRKKSCHDRIRPMLKRASDALCRDLPSKAFRQAFANASAFETENSSLNMEGKELGVQQPEETLIDVSQEERICSRTWSPERLKECRVFLKKINSPETKSAAEECNFCTIKLDDVSSSGYCLPPRTECAERHVRKEIAHVARTESRRSARILSSYCAEDDRIQFRNRKKQKRKNYGTSGSQPLKMARQSLTSS